MKVLYYFPAFVVFAGDRVAFRLVLPHGSPAFVVFAGDRVAFCLVLPHGSPAVFGTCQFVSGDREVKNFRCWLERHPAKIWTIIGTQGHRTP